ncbi:MAG: hypothetical protein LBL33_08270, partial [Tannerella sp.]|nr:hypothetical protein [Tannerella sp.]
AGDSSEGKKYASGNGTGTNSIALTVLNDDLLILYLLLQSFTAAFHALHIAYNIYCLQHLLLALFIACNIYCLHCLLLALFIACNIYCLHCLLLAIFIACIVYCLHCLHCILPATFIYCNKYALQQILAAKKR